MLYLAKVGFQFGWDSDDIDSNYKFHYEISDCLESISSNTSNILEFESISELVEYLQSKIPFLYIVAGGFPYSFGDLDCIDDIDAFSKTLNNLYPESTCWNCGAVIHSDCFEFEHDSGESCLVCAGCKDKRLGCDRGLLKCSDSCASTCGGCIDFCDRDCCYCEYIEGCCFFDSSDCLDCDEHNYCFNHKQGGSCE